MIVHTYNKGSRPKLKATFTNAAGVSVDPGGAITMTVKDPSGTSVNYTYAAGQLTRDSSGVYYRRVKMDTVGTWYYKYVADADGDTETDTVEWAQIEIAAVPL